jgi:hypothetical protein
VARLSLLLRSGFSLLKAGGDLGRYRTPMVAAGLEGRPLYLCTTSDLFNIIGNRIGVKVSRDMGRRGRV